MRQTANYGLNQWDAEDRILREDFNGDNDKIDQTLKKFQQALPYVKLLDVTIEAEAQQVDLDVSQIDFSPYRRFELEAEIATDGKTMRVLVNGLSEGYLYHNTNNGKQLSCNYLAEVGTCRFCFLSRYNADEQISGMNPWWSRYGFEDRYCVAPITWGELTAVNLIAGNGGKIPAGSRFQLFYQVSRVDLTDLDQGAVTLAVPSNRVRVPMLEPDRVTTTL